VVTGLEKSPSVGDWEPLIWVRAVASVEDDLVVLGDLKPSIGRPVELEAIVLCNCPRQKKGHKSAAGSWKVKAMSKADGVLREIDLNWSHQQLDDISKAAKKE
jgi:hypothetical protein